MIFAAALAAADASASGATDPAPTPTPAATDTQPAPPKKRLINGKDPDTVVCHTQEVTGSRFKQRVCLTAREWEARENAAAEFFRQSDASSGRQQQQTSPF